MNTTTATVKLALIALLACWCVRSADSPVLPEPYEQIAGEKVTVQQVVAIDPRLRSAFLMRARGGQWPTPAVDVADATAQLRTHFDAVLEVLERNDGRSLDLALNRLEASYGRTFAADERALWRLTLAARRAENLQRLAAYRDRGQFPLNEGHADHAVPIFVDRHDTACAVGHLMRESGWKAAVDRIATENLLVCLTDVRRGSTVEWTLQSGLTAEEAALVQPAYSSPASQQALDALVGTGASFVTDAYYNDGNPPHDPNLPWEGAATIHNGLRYENFQLRKFVAQGHATFPGIFVLSQPMPIDDPPGGVRADLGEVSSPELFGGIGYSPNWQYANLMTTLDLGFYTETFGPDSALSADLYWISFEIAANDPRVAIDRVGLMLPAGLNDGRVQAWSSISSNPADSYLPPSIQTGLVHDDSVFPGEMRLTITDVSFPNLTGSQIANLSTALDFETNNYGAEVHVDLEPIDRVTINAVVALTTDPHSFQSAARALTHSVRITVVPEPSALLLFSLFGSIFVVRNR